MSQKNLIFHHKQQTMNRKGCETLLGVGVGGGGQYDLYTGDFFLFFFDNGFYNLRENTIEYNPKYMLVIFNRIVNVYLELYQEVCSQLQKNIEYNPKYLVLILMYTWNCIKKFCIFISLIKTFNLICYILNLKPNCINFCSQVVIFQQSCIGIF